jgi:hypothetical protein
MHLPFLTCAPPLEAYCTGEWARSLLEWIPGLPGLRVVYLTCIFTHSGSLIGGALAQTHPLSPLRDYPCSAVPLLCVLACTSQATARCCMYLRLLCTPPEPRHSSPVDQQLIRRFLCQACRSLSSTRNSPRSESSINARL